ncbi:MAG: hypothetical protein RL385_1733, partial [Pseudomonadota bacterium]
LGCCLGLSSGARAMEYFGPKSEYSPSVFTYAFRGFGVGAAGGLAGGYLVARRDGFAWHDYRPLVLGAGIGALAGAGGGLTLGFMDLASDRPGRGNIALRDTLYGTGLGALVGTVAGALVVIRTHDGEHIPFGAAIGTLAGIAGGLIVGLIEGSRIVESPVHRYPGARTWPMFAAVPDGRGGVAGSAGLVGRF